MVTFGVPLSKSQSKNKNFNQIDKENKELFLTVNIYLNSNHLIVMLCIIAAMRQCSVINYQLEASVFYRKYTHYITLSIRMRVKPSVGSSHSHDCVLKQDIYGCILQMGHKAVGPVCFVMHITEPSAFNE